MTSFLELVTLLYWNGLFAGRGYLRAIMTFKVREVKEADPVITAT